MKLLAALADDAAEFHNWNEAERKYLAAELDELALKLAELDEWRKTMPLISAQDLDKLTADVAANTQAIADLKGRVGPVLDQLAAAQDETAKLKQQLADADTPADLSALEAALEAATATAQSIAQAPAVPAPVVPVVNPADPAGPVQTPTDTTATDTASTDADTAPLGPGV